MARTTFGRDESDYRCHFWWQVVVQVLARYVLENRRISPLPPAGEGLGLRARRTRASVGQRRLFAPLLADQGLVTGLVDRVADAVDVG